MSGEYAIEATGLRKSYGAHEVLRGVDLRVERGTLLALLGANGAGKTTLVRILATLDAPDAGTVTVEGLDVVSRTRDVREVIGLTGQDAAVDEMLTGHENLVLMGRLFHLGKDAAHARAARLLDVFGLTEAADKPVSSYSGGMRRRLDIAVSLLGSPAVLFLDEPTTGLDPRSRQALWETIRKLLAAGTTILLTTQYLDEADELADRIVVLDGGRVVADGTPEELKRRIGSERLVLTLPDAAAVARALSLTGGTGLDGSRVSVAVEDPAQVRRLLNEADEIGLPLLAVRLQPPTLDDVFLTLTADRGGEAR
ncbi:ABC-2 type transport system ATP-binding protein [Catenulispora sp. MAP5-51]|jgi:ABC-2 type transport system ATP-binding protein|uniref:ATP-binding cassette domain-containing protein n=1 Tax=Catenulispora sp. MAP5-51 TaxID=3156298 RepID=UPI00351700E2